MAAITHNKGALRWKHPLIVLLREPPLFLEERGYPQDESSADDGGAELSEKATPLDSELLEEPATERAAEESEDEVHDEAEAATFHEFACAEAGKASDDKR